MCKGNINLPPFREEGEISLEKAIRERKSIRRYQEKSLTLSQLSQLLWSAQGMTRKNYRTVPSAGALYPLEIFILVAPKGVDALKEGIYQYKSMTHSLLLIKEGDFRRELYYACLWQEFINEVPISIVVTGDYSRTCNRYGERGKRYVHMEVGHVGQNISLQALTIGLGTVMVGAFNDKEVSRILSLDPNLSPLYVIPVGFPQR